MKALVLFVAMAMALQCFAESSESEVDVINQCKEWAKVDSIEAADLDEYVMDCLQSMTGEYDQPNYAEADIESEEGVQDAGVEQELILN